MFKTRLGKVNGVIDNSGHLISETRLQRRLDFISQQLLMIFNVFNFEINIFVFGLWS